MKTSAIRQALQARHGNRLFQPRPLRAIWAVVLVLGIAAGSVLISTIETMVLMLPLSVVIGVLYASLFFLGHEISHGAVVRSETLRNVLLFPAFSVFLLSPHLWSIWHVRAHHRSTNVANHDPDIYGTLDDYQTTFAFRHALAVAPGSGRVLSLLFPLVSFTLHSQAVLWLASPNNPDFKGLDRRRAILEFAAISVFWLSFLPLFGLADFMGMVLVPMMVANAVVMSFVITNHLVRPLGNGQSVLDSTMSVQSPWWVDILLFNFSHHTEHHLFPSMPSSGYPLVRRTLKDLDPDGFICPTHWQALKAVFGTPRVYDRSGTVLTDPFGSRQVHTSKVAQSLSDTCDLANTENEPANRGVRSSP